MRHLGGRVSGWGRRAAASAAAWLLAGAAALLLPLPVLAQPVGLGLQTSAPAAPTVQTEAVLQVFNREVLRFRAPLLGVSVVDRAARAQQRVEDLIARPGANAVTLQASPLGTLVLIDGATAFLVGADDADKLQGETDSQLAQRAAVALTAAIEATRESRSVSGWVHALLLVTVATAVFALLQWILRRTWRALEDWLLRFSQLQAARLQVSGVALIHAEKLAWAVHGVVRVVAWLLLLLMLYTWVGFVLAQFPYTRVWGQQLNGFLIGLAAGMGRAVLVAVPGLLTVAVIVMLARGVTRVLDHFFDRVQNKQLQLSWLDADVAPPTRRISKIVVWLFALAMAYPYLPGAGTDAFKGLSVLVGLMISIGSSSLVAQVGAGLILTYGRVYRRGEYVRIADHEGTVTEQGMFATRIRTGLGEELTLSNSLVLGAVSKNYSRATQGSGFVLDTTVTIGYDTPWRQVHAMLIDAALATPGVLADPVPRVFQTALSDFYPEYRLVCQAIPSQPRPRALVLSALHENIQDVFNQHGVQIMSPHYRGDTAEPKTVPPARWYMTPARQPAGPAQPDPAPPA